MAATVVDETKPCEEADRCEAQPRERSEISLDFRHASISALALGIAACGDGGSTAGSAPPVLGGTPTPSPMVSFRKPQSDQEAARFLLQTGFSASTAEIADLRDRGYEPWLDRRLSAPMAQTGFDWLAQQGFSTIEKNGDFNRHSTIDAMIWNQLLSGGGEARKRAALALSEVFVVSGNDVDMLWRPHAVARYWEILNKNAFGNFRDLLEDITLNSAMGIFLNTRGNRKSDPGTGRVPDENFAREIMQLFSIGLYELNPDGRLRAGPDGKPIETYTNDDVTGLAKVFTGFDFDFSENKLTPAPENSSWILDSVEYTQKPMTSDTSKWKHPQSGSLHSVEAKSFLGTTIPAGTGADESVRIALDTLFKHPNVGPFIARQMIQRLVTSNPTPDYVRRVAAKFDDNGTGKRGDMRAMFKAIWLDDEALSSANVSSNVFGKVREPMLRFAQWARTFGTKSKSGKWSVPDTSDPASRLGQSPLRPSSVFNFYRPGYAPPNSHTSSNNLLAPEFQIINETSAPGYINFMSQVIEGRQRETQDLETSYSAEIAIAHDAGALLHRLNLLLTAGQLSAASLGIIRGALDGIAVSESSDMQTKLRRVHTGVMLVMAAPEYLVQK